MLGVEDLPAEVNICDQVVKIELLENKTGEITLNTYLISLKEIVPVLIQVMVHCFCSYVLGNIWRRQCFYLFDSHSKTGMKIYAKMGQQFYSSLHL